MAHIVEEGKWEEHARKLWKEHEGDTMEHVRTMEKIIREHCGAVFNTGADGAWEFQVLDADGNPLKKKPESPMNIEEKGSLPPCGQTKIASRVAQRYLARVAFSAWTAEIEARLVGAGKLARMSRHCEFYKVQDDPRGSR